MEASDLIASLSLALSAIVAFAQYRQWRRSQEAIRFSFYMADEVKPWKGFEATITNISPYAIYIEAVWIGTRYRPWLRPWKKVLFEGEPVSKIDGEYLGVSSASGLLKPGDFMEVHFRRDQSDMEMPPLASLKNGFSRQRCIEIEHSGSDHRYFRDLP
jgi:hypothetical protein